MYESIKRFIERVNAELDREWDWDWDETYVIVSNEKFFKDLCPDLKFKDPVCGVNIKTEYIINDGYKVLLVCTESITCVRVLIFEPEPKPVRYKVYDYSYYMPEGCKIPEGYKVKEVPTIPHTVLSYEKLGNNIGGLELP